MFDGDPDLGKIKDLVGADQRVRCLDVRDAAVVVVERVTLPTR
jgi:hypothetical protein